jgi:uncharacterized membrane protein YgcG
LIFQIFLINSASVDPVDNPQSWTPEALYNRVKETYLHPNNPNYKRNLNYMIFDPEFYLQSSNLQDANNAMYTLYEKYKVSTHIFFISYMYEKYKTDEAFAAFVDRLSYLIYNNNDDYNLNMTLTAVFFIHDRKMRIRTTKALRQIITDDDALAILNRRKKDLKNERYADVANGLMLDIYKTYSKNLENPNSNTILFLTILFIIGMAIFVYLANREESSAQEDKVKAFLDKCKQKPNPKEIISESCIICLEDFKSDEEIKALENTDKNAFEKLETSILECGHKFHRKCISDWLKKEEICPICRTKFDIKSNNDNSGNKSNTDHNIHFRHIFDSIIRVQRETNRLNTREIGRIHNIYYPSNNSRRQSSSRSSSSRSSSSKQSFRSYNSGSGGATSGW